MVKGKQESCHDDLCEVMDTKMSDFKQSLGFEYNNVKEKVGKNTVVITHLQADLEQQLKSFEGNKYDVELNKEMVNGLKSHVSQNKTEIEQNRTALSDLKASPNAIQSKVGNIDEKLTEFFQLSEGMELEVIKQKKNHNKLSLSMSTHVTEVEHDLVQHIENCQK